MTCRGRGGPGITDSNLQLGLRCPEGSSRVLGARLSDTYQFTHGLPIDVSPGCQAVFGWSTQSVLGSVLGRMQGARVHNRKSNSPTWRSSQASSHNYTDTWHICPTASTGFRVPIQKPFMDFPGGPLIKNLPASVGNRGSVLGAGRFHMPQGN